MLRQTLRATGVGAYGIAPVVRAKQILGRLLVHVCVSALVKMRVRQQLKRGTIGEPPFNTFSSLGLVCNNIMAAVMIMPFSMLLSVKQTWYCVYNERIVTSPTTLVPAQSGKEARTIQTRPRSDMGMPFVSMSRATSAVYRSYALMY
jgi:hypothetical protein